MQARFAARSKPLRSVMAARRLIRREDGTAAFGRAQHRQLFIDPVRGVVCLCAGHRLHHHWGADSQGSALRGAADLGFGGLYGNLTTGHAAAYAMGSAVVDLIRSIAKREVTFFSGTVAISRL